MMGDGKSLMEQLRGEALKFHKPGEKEPKEQNVDFRLPVHFDLKKKKKTLFINVSRWELQNGRLRCHAKNNGAAEKAPGGDWWPGITSTGATNWKNKFLSMAVFITAESSPFAYLF